MRVERARGNWFVWLFSFVWFVWPEKPNKPEEPESRVLRLACIDRIGAAAEDQPGLQERVQEVHGLLFGQAQALANFFWCHRAAVFKESQ